jgi:hypothetical protein
MGIFIIVCGGRDYLNWPHIYGVLDRALALFHRGNIAGIIEGGASGADAGAAMWAFMHGIPYKTFTAEWKQFGKSAGPIRNSYMLSWAGPAALVFAFPGGRGTRDMLRQAREMKVPAFEFAEEWLHRLGSNQRPLD